MSITTEPNPAPAGAPAAAAQADVRGGFAAILLALALLAAAVAGVLGYNPRLIAGPDVETWAQAFRSRDVWPVVSWAALAAAAGAVGFVFFQQLGTRPGGNEVGGLTAPIGIALLIFALFLAAVPVYLLARRGFQQAIDPVFLWGGLLSLTALSGGLVLLVQDGSPGFDGAKFRITVGATGGLIGFFCVLLGFALPILVFDDVFAAGLAEWRRRWPALMWSALPLVGGLALMFVSAQLGRRLERESQSVRRLVYGYNAVLTGLLLLAVLALPNVLAYADPFSRVLGRPIDWTKDEVNTVSPQLRNYLYDLREPVKVYLLLPARYSVTSQMQVLLDNCRLLSPRFSWELISPLDPSNEERLNKLATDYSLDPNEIGVLVVPADADKDNRNHVFIRYRDLIEDKQEEIPGERAPRRRQVFKGENELLNALILLSEGKMVVYFTQGHGELALGAGGMPAGDGASLDRLKGLLDDRKTYDLRPLKLDGAVKAVPDDAAAVVVAGPTQTFAPEAVKVLQAYLRRNTQIDKDKKKVSVTAGRLLLLLGPNIESRAGRGSMVPTGLDGLLAEYSIKLGNDRVLSFSPNMPRADMVYGIANPSSRNPVALAFRPQVGRIPIFRFVNVRSVDVQGGAPGGQSAERLLLAYPAMRPFVETNLDLTPAQAREAVQKMPRDRQAEILGADSPPALAVVASDRAAEPGMPSDAAHAGLGKTTPRLVVFGSSGWINDSATGLGVNPKEAEARVDLFASCLSWLRERSAVGETIPPKARTEYQLKIDPSRAGRLRWLPLGLMTLGVVGLGLGVWVVRRR